MANGNNNNGANIAKIVCWTLVGLILIAVLVAGLFYGGTVNFFSAIRNGLFRMNTVSTNFDGFNESGTYSVKADNIDNIDIDWVSGYVKVLPYDGEDIVFTEKSNLPLTQVESLRYQVSGSTLSIDYSQNIPLGMNLTIKTLDVQVPRKLIASMREFDIDTVSGYVEISEFTLEKLSVSTTSAEVKLSTITASDKVSIDTVSGEVDLAACVTDRIKVGTTSGAMRLNGGFNEIQANTVSGDFKLDTTVCPAKIDFDSVSGRGTVCIPADSNFTAKHDHVSGDFHSDFPTLMSGDKFVVGTGASDFSFSTVSGDVYVNANK